MLKWERLGVIELVRIPGVRAVRYRMTDVRSLAASIAIGKLAVAK